MTGCYLNIMASNSMYIYTRRKTMKSPRLRLVKA
jgi:hypothetical protein